MSGFSYIPGQTIRADPERMRQHIINLRKMSYLEMLDDVVQD